MSLFLKNLPNSFFRYVISSRPVFNKATSLFSSIAINLDKPSRPVASVGRTHARSICFGSPNDDKKLIWKKFNSAARLYSKKPKTKSVSKSKSDTKTKGQPKKTSSGGVKCAVEQGQMQCQIDCDEISAKKPKEGELPSKKSETSTEAKPTDCEKKCKASTKTQKSASSTKTSKTKREEKCSQPEKKPAKPTKKEEPKQQKKAKDERCEVKNAKALTGTWVSKKCVKYDFKCPGGVKEEGSDPEKVDDCYEMKKPETKKPPSKKESKTKKCDTKASKEKEETKGKIPIEECIESCRKKKKPQEEAKSSAKSNKKCASKKDIQEKKKDDKSCKPCTSKKGIVEDKTESRHGSNTKLMCSVFETKSSGNTNTEIVEKIENLIKELEECKRNRSIDLNKKINECLPSPKLDSKLPKPKEQDKDVVSGSKNFLKTVCDGIFSKDMTAVTSKSASAMSHTKSGGGGAKKSKSADYKTKAKPPKDEKVKKSKSDPCAQDKNRKIKAKKSKSDPSTQGKKGKIKEKVAKSMSDPCTATCNKAKEVEEKQVDESRNKSEDCSCGSRPKPPCQYKEVKKSPEKKQKDEKASTKTKQQDPCTKVAKQKKEATKQKDCIELKIKKEGDEECIELPPCESEPKKDKSKSVSAEDCEPKTSKSERKATKQEDCIELKIKKEGDHECIELPPCESEPKKQKASAKTRKTGKSKTDVCKKKSKENAKSEVFCDEECSKAEDKSKTSIVCPCPPPATRKIKRGKPAKKKSERKMLCTDDPDRKPKLPPVQVVEDVAQKKKKPKGKISPEKKHSQQLVELCRKIGAAVAATKKSEDQPKYSGPPDQSPIMQCIAFCKKKQKADKPQKGKGIPPRDKKPCTSDKKVYKKIVEFSEETEKKQDEIKSFVPCQYEEIKSGVRHDGRGDVDKKTKSEGDRCKKPKKKQKLPKCPTSKKTKKKAKKKAKSKSKQVKKKESKKSVVQDQPKVGQRTCPKIANPCKDKREKSEKEDETVCDCSGNEKEEKSKESGKDQVTCDCSEKEAKKASKKEGKDKAVCDCSEKEDKKQKKEDCD